MSVAPKMSPCSDNHCVPSYLPVWRGWWDGHRTPGAGMNFDMTPPRGPNLVRGRGPPGV